MKVGPDTNLEKRTIRRLKDNDFILAKYYVTFSFNSNFKPSGNFILVTHCIHYSSEHLTTLCLTCTKIELKNSKADLEWVYFEIMCHFPQKFIILIGKIANFSRNWIKFCKTTALYAKWNFLTYS